MIITHKIDMDLARRGVQPRIDAVQGDSLTRQIQLVLYSDGTEWEIPEGVAAVARFVNPDGTGGIYDTLPDGSAACTIDGNTVSAILSPEVTSVSGAVFFAITLVQGDAELSSFALTIIVQRNPNAEVDGNVNSTTLAAMVEGAVEAYMAENPVRTGGLTEAQINALDAMFKVTAFSADPTSAYAAFMEAFDITGGDSGGTETPAETPATSIVLSASTLTFSAEESQTLTATVEPSDTTDSVVWESSNNAIATVENGVVTPVSDGSCTITATAGSVSAECVVTVAIEQEVITYTVTNYLTNVTNSNEATTANGGSAYTATLTAADGYAINADSVVISMNGTEITDNAYNVETGEISIAAVTGDISITATGDVSTDWDFEWDYSMGLMSENGFTKNEDIWTAGNTVSETLRNDGVLLEAGNNCQLRMVPTDHETMESGVMEITFNAQECGNSNVGFKMSNGTDGCNLKMSNSQWMFCNAWAANNPYQTDYTVRIVFNKDGTHSLYANAASDTATKTSTTAVTASENNIYVYHNTSIIVKSVKYKWSA